MDKDFWEENSENKDYPDTETSYLGQKTVLNMVCIILSDQIVNTKEESLEFYSTIPILTPIHFNSFSKIQSVNLRNWKILSMNHFIDSSSISPIFDKYGMKFLSAIPKLHQFANLDLWITEEKIESDFILLKDRILLVFNVMMDGSLLLTTIRHKGYLNRFFTNFMKKKIKKISYSHAEAIAFLEKKPAFIDDLLSKGIDTVYNFITLGYLLKRQELDTLEGSDRIKDLLFKLFHNILTSDTNFLLTLDSLTQFFATGKALVPLLGPFDFPQEERISYLERFNLYLNGEKSDKVRILNCELPNLSILCLPGINIVYYADDTYQSERFYYFESDSLNNLLKKEISEDDLKTLDFNGEMWNYCIEELRTNVHPWVY